MAHHDGGSASGYGRGEGRKLQLLQLVQALVHHRQVVVGVSVGVPVAGEVLEHRHHAALRQTLHHLGNQPGHIGAVRAQGPAADDRIVWVRPHVSHRGEVHIDAQGGALGGQGLAQRTA